jgi:hypothetical protein
MTKPFSFIRNSTHLSDELVHNALRWEDEGRLDENVEDECVVLDLLWELDSLCEEKNDQACLSVVIKIRKSLVKTKTFVVDDLKGCLLDDSGEHLDTCDWNGAMPVIDSELRLTGHWVYWDVTDDSYVNYRDAAAISVEDARAAGLAIEDGYALSQEGR